MRTVHPRILSVFPFNMSAQSEPVHVDEETDKNMDETSEEAESQQTVLTLESILLYVVFLFLYLVPLRNRVIGRIL